MGTYNVFRIAREKMSEIPGETVSAKRCFVKMMAAFAAGVGYGIIIGVCRMGEVLRASTASKEANHLLDVGGWVTAFRLPQEMRWMFFAGTALLGLCSILLGLDARLAPPTVRRRDMQIVHAVGGAVMLLLGAWIASPWFWFGR